MFDQRRLKRFRGIAGSIQNYRKLVIAKSKFFNEGDCLCHAVCVTVIFDRSKIELQKVKKSLLVISDYAIQSCMICCQKASPPIWP